MRRRSAEGGSAYRGGFGGLCSARRVTERAALGEVSRGVWVVIGDGWHVIEQQAYADAGGTIDALELLCSGFYPDGATP